MVLELNASSKSASNPPKRLGNLPLIKTPLAIYVLVVSLIGEIRTADVCIIGSGIGGSSAASFLKELDSDLKIEVFEKQGDIGGRTKTITLEGLPFPVDAGASIMHKANKYMTQFAEKFGLEINEPPSSTWGIFDGSSFIIESSGSATITAGKLYWRYGNDLMLMKSSVEKFIEKFSKIYDLQSRGVTFDHPTKLLEALDLSHLTEISFETAMTQIGVRRKIIQELMTAINRVNYGQNCSLNGLAGMTGLAGAGDDLRVIKGGFQQVPKRLLEASKATVHLNTTVSEISKDGSIGYKLTAESGSVYSCQAVIIAAPMEQSMLKLPPILSRQTIQYHLTQTTFVKGTIRSTYFGKSKIEKVPGSIYTIEDAAIQFNSIGCYTSDKVRDSYFKIFSRTPLSDSFLKEVFEDFEVLLVIPWKAYPRFNPPEKFSLFERDRGLVYLNTFESAASAMELAAISAKNGAMLVYKRLKKHNGDNSNKEEL